MSQIAPKGTGTTESSDEENRGLHAGAANVHGISAI